MNHMKLRRFAVLALLVLASTLTARSTVASAGPLVLTGSLGGAAYKIEVPAPRSARPLAADATSLSRVTAGSRYVVVNPPADHGACTRTPLAVCGPGARRAPLRVLVGPPHLPAAATAAAVPTPCPPGTPQGAVCGTIAVPLDRKHPGNGTIPIFFKLFAHTSPGPPQSAILANQGGPGLGTTTDGFMSLFLSLFSKNLDVHDLLLVDDRGRGLSGTIGCSPFQHGTEPFAQAEAACATQLGPAASRYGTGDVAQDTDAVRAALGYDKVDYFGVSAGGQDVSAYATRFGAHLRSIVLDAPYGPPDLAPFVYAHDQTQAEPRMVRLACAYSPTCAADHPDPVADLDGLVSTIRAKPLEGDAYDANGNLVHVRIDEAYLLWYIIHAPTFPVSNFILTGELVAAATALRQGDPAPLLRLGAEGFFSGFPSPGGDNGDPTIFSAGAQRATGCVDATEPWDWSAAVPGRQAQYDHAVGTLPADYFAPFSKAATTGLLFSRFGAQCLWWQKPTPSSPVTPPRSTYPNVPTLVLDGDMDAEQPLEEATKVAALFPGSMLVPVAEAGHATDLWSPCAGNLASQFIETLQPGDISCTKTPETVFPAVGRFPLLAQDAIPAAIDPSANNQIGAAERRVVTVAVAAATDALQRSYLSSSGSDHCLRSGTFSTTYGSSGWTTSLTNCAFAQDVTVNGIVTWDAGRFGGPDNSLVADLVVSGPGTAGGTLHVAGTWLAPGPVGDFTVSGQLGGLNVGVLVPEA